MAGRNKQPLSVIQGKGRSKHLTQKDIEERKRHEEWAKGYTDKIEPPSYLTQKQKEEFNKISAELVRLGIFSNLDVDNLARYIDSRDQYIRVVRLLRSVKASDFKKDFKTYAQIQRSKNLLFNECRSAAGDLGLTITSRLKLVIPQQEDEAPKSEAERRFSGRL